MRVAVRFGLAPDFELEPLAVSGGIVGGFRDSLLPNYVYRWTEREVEKTVRSADPGVVHDFRYFYGYRLPHQRLAMSTSALKRRIGHASKVALPIVTRLAPHQGNEFGFAIVRTERCRPWLQRRDGELVPNMDYVNAMYDKSKYVTDTSSDLPDSDNP